MTWKKYFKPTTGISGPSISGPDRKFTSVQKYSSWLPEIYEGPSDRLTRYQIYETMDYDHEVHAALDTISDFSTENDSKTKRPFTIEFDGNPAPTEVTIVSKMLKQWCTLNEMDKRLWGMFRGTLMYGDQFFIRDPETFKLFWCDPKKVTKAIVNESKGKKIECFYVKDLDLNVKDMIATSQQQGDQGRYAGASILFSAPFNGVIGFGNATSGNAVTDGRFGEEGEVPINADHMLQLTLSDGMTSSWPFGTSVLEYVYKVYKQKELLEDSVIIYRIHRAPERRVFFIDVGQMPPNKAQQYLERVRYEVQQKRIPSKSGGGTSLTDSGYNPMSQLEDYFFSVTSEGRGSSVQTLPGGENLGCFSLDTKVKLLDGRDLSISEIEKEMKEGKQLWTYSCDPISGEIAPGKIDWAGTTRKDAEVMKLVLSNGNEVVCTYDHKFPVLGKGFVEAQDFVVGDTITAFNYNDGNVFDSCKGIGIKYNITENVGKYEVTLDAITEDKIYDLEISIIDIIHLGERTDVGTLTIDQDELIHDYHTYALSAGVFTKNSIDDLRYFNNKMLRALGVPSSYLPTGPEDGTASYNDGRLGTAFIQEFRFSKVCERYQKQISKAFDREFKLYLKHRGVNIDNSTFELKLPEPQSFSEYRQLELDAAKINVFQSMADIPYISKRFALKRYLNLSEEEMAMNEKMWKEEQGAAAKQQSSAKNDLSSAGITSSGIDSMAPMGGFDEEEFTDDLVDDFGGEEDFDDEGFDTDADLGGEEPEV